MARPLYIICSESGAEDTSTRMFSIFNIIEQIRLRRYESLPGEPPTVLRAPPLRIQTAWMRAEEEFGSVFEHQVVLHFPGQSEEEVVKEDHFPFIDRVFRVSIQGQMPEIHTPGIFRIESRLRRAGNEKWSSQEYPIIVEEMRTA